MLRRLFIILVFSTLLLLPWVQKFSHALPDLPLNENRPPAVLPSWKGSSLRSYLEGCQSWFNDRYPGRSFLIRLKNQIEFSAFRYSDRVYIGTDGWLFYRSTFDDGVRAFERLPDAQIERLADNLAGLGRSLKAKNLTLVVLDNQLKYEFYGDKLPSEAGKLAQDSKYKRLRKLMSASPDFIYIDSSRLLHQLLKSREVFHRTDFHWNDPAAFEVGRALVDRLAADSRRPGAGWKHTLQIEQRSSSGGEAAFMPLLRPVSETAQFVLPTWRTDMGEHRTGPEPFEWTYTSHKPSADLLPPSVIFGDSFTDGLLRSGFPEHFESLSRARIFHCTLEEAIAACPTGTRYFILQFIETNIASVMPKP